MLFPYSDDDRRIVRPTPITMLLLLANLGVFAIQWVYPMLSYGWSVVPYEILHGVDLVGSHYVEADGHRYEIPQAEGPWPIYWTILTAMFMHGGLLHLGSNMLYLWIFGDNVEHEMGSRRFLGFYLMCGLVATIAQILTTPESVVPLLGASGAIAGVLGAYLVYFPRNRVRAFFLFFPLTVPALLLLGLWIVMQIFSNMSPTQGGVGGVAYTAHIAGFIAGVVLALIRKRRAPAL